MDFYEDNHIYSNPQQLMVVALHDGEKPPFAEAVIKDEPKKSEAVGINIEGIGDRNIPIAGRGREFLLPQGREE